MMKANKKAFGQAAGFSMSAPAIATQQPTSQCAQRGNCSASIKS